MPFYLSEAAAADGLTIRQQLDAAVDEAQGFDIPIKVGPVCRRGRFASAVGVDCPMSLLV